MMTVFSTWQYEVQMEDVEVGDDGEVWGWWWSSVRSDSSAPSAPVPTSHPAPVDTSSTCHSNTVMQHVYMWHGTWHVMCDLSHNMFDCQQCHYVTTDRGSSVAVAPNLCSPLTSGLAIHLGMGKSANVVGVLYIFMLYVFTIPHSMHLSILWLDISSRRRPRLAQ